MPYVDPINRDLPFQSGSETSHDAAIHAKDFVGDQGLTVLAWIRRRGDFGATQKEASAALGIGRPSLCARFRALEQAGSISKTTSRRCGCAVYQATERT
jgi:hypothetical protein